MCRERPILVRGRRRSSGQASSRTATTAWTARPAGR
jgi:hypothetical protein